jgi:hypothetical protein
MLEWLNLNIETPDDRNLLSKSRINPIAQKVATIKTSRTQIADQLADMTLPTAPIQYPHLVERTVEVLFTERFYKPGQVDGGIVA